MSSAISRRLLLVVHPTRSDAKSTAEALIAKLASENFEIVSTSEIEMPGIAKISLSELGDLLSKSAIELAVVLGGDGTILRAAQAIRGSSVPLLGVNLGHVGFLAQIGRPTIAELATAIIAKNYKSERRMVLQYRIERAGQAIAHGWALNEVTIERSSEAMVELLVQIDHRPLSRWGCDGIICATPTGSTAYAFSAGGPIVWPEVEALVLLPLAAHALFSRPMVISPESIIAVDIESEEATLSADGLRKFQLVENDRVILTSDNSPINLAQIDPALFTDRLVAKFKLPVEGWRGE
ncbi:MAG: NAD kinase [Actinobacteria bacterium]|jgi:NAD+ kinase|nr:NAD kinase [Actinomycetota bacterium]NDH12466.1 NAD kinase [Actinomycetota bacterium]